MNADVILPKQCSTALEKEPDIDNCGRFYLAEIYAAIEGRIRI